MIQVRNMLSLAYGSNILSPLTFVFRDLESKY
jgi:hypothetical protein